MAQSNNSKLLIRIVKSASKPDSTLSAERQRLQIDSQQKGMSTKSAAKTDSTALIVSVACHAQTKMGTSVLQQKLSGQPFGKQRTINAARRARR